MFFIKNGKFKKFEQQRERRTESYGVVSTAFNRFEDSGIEFGFDLTNGFYGRLSVATGNPVFIRDVNALAGDTGVDSSGPEFIGDPTPDLGTGLVTLYDAEVEDFDLTSNPEVGLGLGYRWNSANQNQKLDLLVYHYERNLAETRDISGSFLGGDLDIFDVSDLANTPNSRLPFKGRDKSETGVNVWYYAGDFALFAQYVSQEVASLDREGFEIEGSYVFDLPITVTPVIRYSELDNNFVSTPSFLTPSLMWDWRKIDYGVNLDVSDNIRLTLEYADNEVFRAGRWEDQSEFLITFRWRAKFKR